MDVTLTFLTFDLENDPLPGGDGDCKYDWLEVWDGLPGGKTADRDAFGVFLGDEPFSRANTLSAVKAVCTLPCLHHYRLRWSSRYFSSAALVDES